MITMRNTKKWIVVALVALASVACGKKATKPDKAKAEQVSATAAELGMSEESIASFQKAIDELKKAKPDNAVALAALEKSVQLEPEFAEAHYNLGLLQLALGDNEAAQKSLSTAKQLDPDVPEYTVALGRAQAEVGNHAEAEVLFQEVVAREPNNLTAKNNLAVLAFYKDDAKAALKHLQEILREDSENVAALTTLGQVYHKQGNLSLAKYVYQRAIKVAEKNPDLHNNLGLVYLEEKNVPDAVKEFALAVQHNPNYLESRLNLGAILLEYLDYERASEQFTEAVRIAPKHCVARLGQAAAEYALGKHAESDKNYDFYINECDQKHLSSHERIAKLNETYLNNPTRAVEYYKKALNLTTDEEKLANYKAMIGFLEKQGKQTTPKPAPPQEGEGDGEEGASEDGGDAAEE